MNFPIRCFTCGKVINPLWEEYTIRIKKEEEPEAILDSFKLKRFCCRRMFLTHVDIDHVTLLYPTYPNRIQRLNFISEEIPQFSSRKSLIKNDAFTKKVSKVKIIDPDEEEVDEGGDEPDSEEDDEDIEEDDEDIEEAEDEE
jgi:DNA-directed RNA polymerase subunit N